MGPFVWLELSAISGQLARLDCLPAMDAGSVFFRDLVLFMLLVRSQHKVVLMAYFCIWLLCWDGKVAIMIYEISLSSMEVWTMISRWVSLVVCLCLLALVASPVQSASPQILNPGFDDNTGDSIKDWPINVSSEACVYSSSQSGWHVRSSPNSLGVKSTSGIEVSQCVSDTRGLKGTAFVGVHTYALTENNASVRVDWYAETDCVGDPIDSGTDIDADGYGSIGQWFGLSCDFEVSETYQSMRITLMTNEGEAWFDDAFFEYTPTAVAMYAFGGSSEWVWTAAGLLCFGLSSMSLISPRLRGKRHSG